MAACQTCVGATDSDQSVSVPKHTFLHVLQQIWFFVHLKW